MSGAAVFDVERNLVIGFVFQVWEPGQSAKDRDLAFAVDAAVLGSSPVGDLLIPDALEPESLARPEFDQAIGEVISAPVENAASVGWAMQTAPDNLGVFVGREQELGFIEQLWQPGQARIIGISGFAGQGKTSLVRTWLEGHRQVAGPTAPHSVLWWTFDASFNEVDDFLAAVIRHVSDGRIDPAALPPGIAKANLAAALLQSSRRHVIVLDGLDAMQVDRGDLAGSLTSSALKDFLDYVAAGRHQSLCVLTGTRDFQDFEHIATFRSVRIGPLSPTEGRALLRANGVHGTDQLLDELVSDWEGHALALTAIAVYLTAEGRGQARRLAELPSRDPGLPFAARLRAVGTMIERLRTPVERAALIMLALARLPLPVTALAAIVRDTGVHDDARHIQKVLSALADSEAVRAAANGDVLLHPVLRSLYRTELYTAGAQPAMDFHRLLAEYYYQAATELQNQVGRA